jgi:PLP dependent protein
MNGIDVLYNQVQQRIRDASGTRAVTLVAVSKLQSAEAIRALAAGGHRQFGENYIQEAGSKQTQLADLDLEWHLIGPLQSNKCREAARQFDWVQTLDRSKLIPLLARERPAEKPPLNVLIQVNISDEASKSGCAPDATADLARQIHAEPHLRLRGLMCIPAPWPDLERRRDDFQRMRLMFEEIRIKHASIDTLSMGMSDDFALAISEGATMVRIGSALFGTRPVTNSTANI